MSQLSGEELTKILQQYNCQDQVVQEATNVSKKMYDKTQKGVQGGDFAILIIVNDCRKNTVSHLVTRYFFVVFVYTWIPGSIFYNRPPILKLILSWGKELSKKEFDEAGENTLEANEFLDEIKKFINPTKNE